MKIDINIQNKFTIDEKELFSILREVVKKYSPSTEIYLVGGAVRDLLMGQASNNDIDIMLSNISGQFFAELVTKYLGIKDAHVIKANPEKSKNITTATANIPLSSGKILQVDFAQARSEIYKEDSRIPEITTATPEQDAFRRDLTINSIFWNISTNELKDFTGMGLKDLITQTIRTPAEPLKTFSDDPLRIFRVCRFASKYGWEIDPSTYKAMLDPSLRDKIKQKVSKERIGAEFLKMMKNPNSQKAIEILKSTGLLQDIISEALRGTEYEGKMAELDMNQENPNHKLNLWAHTMEVVKEILSIYGEAEPEKRMVMTLAALMHDTGKLYQNLWSESKTHPGHRAYHGHEDASAKITELIFSYLKIENYMKQVSGLVSQHMRPHGLIRNEGGFRAMRKFIRTISEQSISWLDVFNLAVADAYAKDTIKDPKIVEDYKLLEQNLQDALISLSPQKGDKIEPILNGNEIMTALGVRPGPQMKDYTEFVKDLKDENPAITKEEAIQKLKERYSPKVVPAPATQTGQTDNVVTASSEDDKKKTSACPKHLFEQKKKDIEAAVSSKNYYEANSIMKKLKDEYGKDEAVSRLIGITSLKILIADQKFRDNDLLQYIFDMAKTNFFDYIIGAYALGIILLIDTATESEVIKELATRISNLSPGTMKYVLSLLPTNKVYNKEEYDSIVRFFK